MNFNQQFFSVRRYLLFCCINYKLQITISIHVCMYIYVVVCNVMRSERTCTDISGCFGGFTKSKIGWSEAQGRCADCKHLYLCYFNTANTRTHCKSSAIRIPNTLFLIKLGFCNLQCKITQVCVFTISYPCFTSSQKSLVISRQLEYSPFSNHITTNLPHMFSLNVLFQQS